MSVNLSKRFIEFLKDGDSCKHDIPIRHKHVGNFFEGYWDSEIHQEKTMNAIIRKHGFTDWYDCWTHQWLPYESKENDEASIHI